MQGQFFSSWHLAYSVFLLIYTLIFIIIYQEVYENDILKDIFINFFYILLISVMIYNNYKIFGIIKNEEKNILLISLDIPNFYLDKIIYIYYYIQSIFYLLIVLTIITCGIFGWYWLYKQGDNLDKVDGASNSGIIYLVIGVFGLSIISWALMQDRLNKLSTNTPAN